MNSSVTNQQKTNSSSPPRLLDHLPRINNSSEHEDDEYDHEELFRIASPGRHVFTLADSAAMTTTRFQPPLGTVSYYPMNCFQMESLLMLMLLFWRTNVVIMYLTRKRVRTSRPKQPMTIMITTMNTLHLVS